MQKVMPCLLRRIGLLAGGLALVCSIGASVEANGAVVVLNNRTPQPVAVVLASGGASASWQLEPGDSRPFLADHDPVVEYASQGAKVRHPISLGSAYYFMSEEGQSLKLRRIDLGHNNRPRSKPSEHKQSGSMTLSLLVYVDEEEPMRRERWQHRLTQRVAAASTLMEQHAEVALRIARFGQWESDNTLRKFEASLAEFEREVTPSPGTIAVGFSSQFELSRARRRRLGGTRGPLRKHLLLREWSPQLTEAERLEALVHELGHYLGAAHSPEPQSVMRPVLGNGSTRLKSYRIRFDPLNTLVIATVGEELRHRPLASIEALSFPSRQVLQGVYTTLADSLPKDLTAQSMVARIARQNAREMTPELPLQIARRAVASAAEANRQRPRKSKQNSTGPYRQWGDNLTNLLVRSAAKELAQLPPSRSTREAFLLALGLAIDDTGVLLHDSRIRARIDGAGSPKQQTALGQNHGYLSARGRPDSLKHFLVSAAFCTVADPKEVALRGFGKEALDSQGGSGFSYADLAADQAGLRFAQRVLQGTLPLSDLAARFEVRHFVPSLENLPEGLSSGAYADQFGGLGDERHEAMVREIDRRLDALPPYARLRIELP